MASLNTVCQEDHWNQEAIQDDHLSSFHGITNATCSCNRTSFAGYVLGMIVVSSQMDDCHPVSRYCSTDLQEFGEMVFLEDAYEVGCNCRHCCMTYQSFMRDTLLKNIYYIFPNFLIKK